MRLSSLSSVVAAGALLLAPLSARAARSTSADKGHFLYPVQNQTYKFFIGDTVNFTWSVISDYATFTLSSDDNDPSISYAAVTGLDGNNGSLAKLIEDDTPPGKYYALVVNNGIDFNVSYFDIANTTHGQQPKTWNAWDGKTHPTPTGSAASTSSDAGSTTATGTAGSATATSSQSANPKIVRSALGLGAKIAVILGIVLVLVLLGIIGACIILRRKSTKKQVASSPGTDGTNLPELKRNSMLGLGGKPQNAGYYEMDSKANEFKGHEMPAESQYQYSNIQRPPTAVSAVAPPSYGSPTPPPPGTGYSHHGYAGYGQQTPVSPATPVGTSLPQNHGFVFSNPPVEVPGQPVAAEMPAPYGAPQPHEAGGHSRYQHGVPPRPQGGYPSHIAEMAG